MTTSTRDHFSNSNNTVTMLLTRSNRLGADPRNTNYAGGNTSAKGAANPYPSGTGPIPGTWLTTAFIRGSLPATYRTWPPPKLDPQSPMRDGSTQGSLTK